MFHTLETSFSHLITFGNSLILWALLMSSKIPERIFQNLRSEYRHVTEFGTFLSSFAGTSNFQFAKKVTGKKKTQTLFIMRPATADVTSCFTATRCAIFL